jgi:hypothetical protein
MIHEMKCILFKGMRHMHMNAKRALKWGL